MHFCLTEMQSTIDPPLDEWQSVAYTPSDVIAKTFLNPRSAAAQRGRDKYRARAAASARAISTPTHPRPSLPPAHHPTRATEPTSQPAGEPVMAPLAAARGAPAAPKGARTFTMAEVARHASEDSAWLVVDGAVYDLTDYLDEHPGGLDTVLSCAGADATDDFLPTHSDDARALLAQYYIGDVAPEEPAAEPAAAEAEKEEGGALESAMAALQVGGAQPAPALDPKKWVPFELVRSTEVSHDTVLLRFALAGAARTLGLPVGHHLSVQAEVGGELVSRAYTPTSAADAAGFFELLVKVYRAGVHPHFPAGGKMSQHLGALAVGAALRVRGPVGHFAYGGRGQFTLRGAKRGAHHFGFICGGTGITPAFQVMQAVAADPDDDTQVSLVYANRSEGDILLREELDRFAKRDNIRVWYTIDGPPDGWEYGSGRVDEAMFRKHLPQPGPDTVIGMCGPPPMIKMTCVPALERIGFEKSNYFSF